MLGLRLVPLVLLIFLPSRVPGQQPQLAGGTMRGFVIAHPERLSGSWEAKGDHAIYGLNIQLTTRVDGAPITLIGVQQIFHSALIEVYERTGPTRRYLRRPCCWKLKAAPEPFPALLPRRPRQHSRPVHELGISVLQKSA